MSAHEISVSIRIKGEEITITRPVHVTEYFDLSKPSHNNAAEQIDIAAKRALAAYKGMTTRYTEHQEAAAA